MGRAWGRRLLPLLLGLLAAAGAAGCSRAVEGRPAAAPPHAFPVTVAPSAPAVPTNAQEPSAAPSTGPSAGVSARPSTLQPDVLADECLLDTKQLAALLGRPVGAAQQAAVARDGGSRTSSCYVTSSEGDAAPLAAINVYRVRTGTPEQFVRAAAAGGRTVTRAGEAAAVLDTAAGPALQVASTRFLVTVVVYDHVPTDAAWRAAARAALARLP